MGEAEIKWSSSLQQLLLLFHGLKSPVNGACNPQGSPKGNRKYSSGWNQTAHYGGTVLGVASWGWFQNDHFRQVVKGFSGHMTTAFCSLSITWEEGLEKHHLSAMSGHTLLLQLIGTTPHDACYWVR